MPDADAISFGGIGKNMLGPLGNLSATNLGTILLVLLVSLLVIGLIAWLFYIWYKKRLYNEKVWILGNVGNTPQIKRIDRARFVKIGNAGDRLFHFAKMKRYVVPPTLQSGNHLWIFWEREDGELINVAYEDVDFKQRSMGIKFVDADMRMQRLGIEKNLEHRLQKKSMWEQYGALIVNIIFLVLVTVCLVVLFMRLEGVSAALTEAVTIAGEVLKEAHGVNPARPDSLVPVGLGGLFFTKWLKRRKKN